MARRYDTKTTTFSPQGRLFQVEYALEAINNASATIGIVAKDGIVLLADSDVISKLLDQEKEKEKIYEISEHVTCAVAGWTADANILVNLAREVAQKYTLTYGVPQPVEQLVTRIADAKQSYTQFGGLRPFGVSFLFAGHDLNHKFQLYQTDPAGRYTGWKAVAMGQNNQSAQSILRQDWNEDLTTEDALALGAKIFVKILSLTTPTAERFEFAVLSLDETTAKPVTRVLGKEEIEKYIQQAIAEEEKRVSAQQKAHKSDP